MIEHHSDIVAESRSVPQVDFYTEADDLNLLQKLENNEYDALVLRGDFMVEIESFQALEQYANSSEGRAIAVRKAAEMCHADNPRRDTSHETSGVHRLGETGELGYFNKLHPATVPAPKEYAATGEAPILYREGNDESGHWLGGALEWVVEVHYTINPEHAQLVSVTPSNTNLILAGRLKPEFEKEVMAKRYIKYQTYNLASTAYNLERNSEQVAATYTNLRALDQVMLAQAVELTRSFIMNRFLDCWVRQYGKIACHGAFELGRQCLYEELESFGMQYTSDRIPQPYQLEDDPGPHTLDFLIYTYVAREGMEQLPEIIEKRIPKNVVTAETAGFITTVLREPICAYTSESKFRRTVEEYGKKIAQHPELATEIIREYDAAYFWQEEEGVSVTRARLQDTIDNLVQDL